MKSDLDNPIIAALDVDDPHEAAILVEKLQPYVGGFKVGPRLSLRADKSFFKMLSQAGIFFWDHKYFDIPSTTKASVEVAAEIGADWVTVHALNGPECLAQLSELEIVLRKQNHNFRVLAVTVLTSFNEKNLPVIWRQEKIESSVLALAKQAWSSKISSFVCSPQEIQLVKKEIPESFLVIPGIRPATNVVVSDDQQRTETPASALENGASALVIGRPIIAHKNPAAAAKEIFESL